MTAWKSSVAVVFGAVALVAGHTGGLTASVSDSKAWAGQLDKDIPREADATPTKPPVMAEWLSPASGSIGGNGAYFAPTLRFRPGAGSLDLAFGIDESGPVTLEAFDARGNLLATLLSGEKAAGFHRLSLFSNRLQGKTGQVFFRLRAGGAVLAEMRAASR